MGNSKAGKENIGNSQIVIVWILLMFVLTVVGASPLIIGGLNLEVLPQSSPLIPLVFSGILVTSYAPTLAALLITGLSSGADGVRSLLRQVGTWRIGVSWYGLLLIGPIILILFANVIYIMLGGSPPEQWLIFPSNLAFIGSLFAGSLGEELGWRGFALPRLQNRYGALWASIIIGLIWSTWHLWPVITPGGMSHFTPANLLQTYIRLISTAIIYTWIYNSSNRSLFPVFIAHAGHNIAIQLIQLPTEGKDTVSIIIALLYMAAAIAIVLKTAPHGLSWLKVEDDVAQHPLS